MIIAFVNDSVKMELEKLQDKKIIYCENEHMVRVNLMEYRKAKLVLISPDLIPASNIKVLNTQVKQISSEIREVIIVIDDETSDELKELIRNSVLSIIYKENLNERLA